MHVKIINFDVCAPGSRTKHWTFLFNKLYIFVLGTKNLISKKKYFKMRFLMFFLLKIKKSITKIFTVLLTLFIF